MKEKILKKSTSVLSILLIICMLAMIFVPSFVKSAQVVVSSVTNTSHGIGKAGVYTAKINGYSNLYCVRGGAMLESGMQLNDDGLSLYKVTGAVVTNSSAIQWLLDNMYLTEGTNANTQKAMKENLKKIMKKYNTYKNSNGEYLLNKKLNGNGINDAWINTAVEDVVKDTTTLYAVQQFVLWNHVKNTSTNYYNVMQNSDGSYNAIPNATAKRVHYTALYITLNELSAEAQKNGYKSPNNSDRGFDVKIEQQANFKKTVSSDRKTVLTGPYKLKNNHAMFTKTLSATINSDKADKVEAVNANGKAVNISETQGEFYLKFTYNKGFQKGTEYKININVGLSGYRTFATLLDTPTSYHQPLVSIRKEGYNTSTKTSLTVVEKLEGDYNLVLEKVDSTNANKKISGVTFKVKEAQGAEKAYGPTGSDGKVTVFKDKTITQEGIDQYTITEVDLGKNEGYIKLKDDVTIYVTKAKSNNAYVASKVSFDKDKEVKTKQVTLEDGSKVAITAGISGDTVRVVIPNKPEEEPEEFDMALRKNISEVKRDGQKINIGEDRNPSIIASSAAKYMANKTAGYYHTKNTVTVKPGDTVIYNIRVYNEGTIDGYAKEITDYLPSGLEFVENSQINKDNNWVATKNEDGTTKVVTNKLKDALIKAANGAEGFIEYYTSQSEEEPNFSKCVQIECKVNENIQDSKLLVNVAEITNYGYNDEQGKYIEANKEKVDIDSEQNNVFTKKENIKNIDEYYNNNVKPQYNETNIEYKGEQDDDDFESLLVKPDVKEFDMALRKYISEVKRNGQKVDIGEDRTPSITEASATKYNSEKTAGYYHTKNPVTVKPGDLVVYTLRVYNEGNLDGYAKQITDYLPAGLEYVEDSQINKDNNWVVTKNADGTTKVVTDKLKDVLIPAANGAEGFLEYSKDQNAGEPEFSKYVQIECKIKEDIEDSKLLVNVAEITNYGYNDNQGNYVEANKEKVDIDSEQDNVFTKQENIKNIDDYYNNNVKPQYSETNKEYKGNQDDDDFENVLVQPDAKEFKFVLNKVDEQGNPLIGADFTVEKLVNDKKDVLLNNEEVKGTYEVLENDVRFNNTYTYKVVEVESAPEYVNVMEGKYVTIKTYMNNNKDLVLGIYKSSENTETTTEDEYYAKYGFIINNTDGSLVKDNETDLYEKIKVNVNNNLNPSQVTITIPNALEEKDFDLALRKFITNINDKEVTSRIPVFKIDENGNYIYEHTKEPVLVANTNIVTYTLRVYNEGEVAGYATEIKDDIPEGLEFLPDNELNKEYRWLMLDKYGKETDNVDEAEYVVTDYLSKEQEKTEGSNLLKPFDVESYEAGSIKEPDYKEVKVSFKVNVPDKSDEIIINQAQISEDSDKDGNPVEDIDSTPNKWIDGEDDQDIEKIKVQYFDLALRKWVTKAIVIENGVETINETGHKAEDDPEAVVKVDLKKSNIDDVTVKFEYKIRIENQGQIAGYAKEISDYIPEGLKFVKEDNPDWEEVDGKVITEALKDTLLQPGETAEVSILLTWINSEDNMGLKVNIAEISKDYNEYGTPDIDSTPNNKVEGEDDIDDAPVMLTVTTGEEPVYVLLTISVLAILAGGLIAIKKFVL